jgi:formate dehydrogenase major subunit
VKISSVCTYCGVGCDLIAEVEDNKIIKITGGNGVVSQGKLCIKGKYGFEYLYSDRRIKGSRIKKNFIDRNKVLFSKLDLNFKEFDENFYEVDFQTASKIVAMKVMQIQNEFGSKSIVGIGGARTSCENVYTFQKFIREIIKSPHIDNCARVCHSPSLKGLKETLGEGASTNPFDDILNTKFIILFGSNMSEAHPIASNRVIKAIQNGANLALFDVRDIKLSKFAKHNCVIPYESNLLVLNMIAYVILNEKLYNEEFISKRVKGFDEYSKSILNDKYANPKFFESIKGYEYLSEMIPLVAREYANNSSFILWGLGITEHIDGSQAVMAIANLSLITGNIGRSDAGLMPLRGQNNVQGACDMGALPYFLPDYKTPKEIGLMTPDIINEIDKGSIKAMFNMGEDLAHIHPNQNKIQKALPKLDMLVVNEILPNEITSFADVVFGVKSAYEKEGVYINAERRLHLSKPLIESDLPDDWEVFESIATNMQMPLNSNSPKEIWQEVRGFAKDRFEGASYELISKADGIQWPIKDDLGTIRLHTKNFRTEDGIGILMYNQWKRRGMVDELLDSNSIDDFYLTTGRVLEMYNNSAQTMESQRLFGKYGEDFLLASNQDRDKFKGNRVKLISKYGESEYLNIKFTDTIKTGTLFCTFHFAKSKINFLFGDESDSFVKTACFKNIKVKISQ